MALVGLPGTASADPNVCGYNETAIFYNSNTDGAYMCTDQNYNIPDFVGYTFNYTQNGTGGTSGYGQAVKNNAASVSNYQNDRSYRVYYNRNYAGVYQTFAPFAYGNLNSQLKNENASGKSL